MMADRINACYVLHDDCEFLEASIRSLAGEVPVVVLVSRMAWSGRVGDWQRSEHVARSAGAEVVVGDWADESTHRQAALELIRSRGYRHTLIPDSDEILESTLLTSLLSIAKHDLADKVRVWMDTYWKDTSHIVRPREHLAPILMIRADSVEHQHVREYGGGRELLLSPEYGVIHHLSYAGGDERILSKINSWSHRHEIVHGWYQKVWKGWDENPLLRNLHPTHPSAYGFIERIEPPMVLAGVMPIQEQLSLVDSLPRISVVIPVFGSSNHLQVCLDHLSKFSEKVHEVIVIDNASPDDAAEIAASYSFVHLIRNEENLGFAKASNQGIAAASGDFVLFLNSDAFLPELALHEMCRSLKRSGTIAAVGPYSNAVGHGQRIDITYTGLDTMALFADTFARMDRDDSETDMLVGFCLLCRKPVLDEIGGFDEDFGLGTFEDNDLCYRLRRSGYRLLICGRAFVHHVGSASLVQAVPDPYKLLTANQARFQAKWRDDLELGFASTLSGISSERVVFHEENRPEALRVKMQKAAKQARISLCMIVKNEERVLADCLRSASPFFFEMIVVDTGSTDRTIEIARELGATVIESSWEDSFSAARNESLQQATGDWVFWLDADDTLPFRSGEAIVNAAIHAPEHIIGFVVPVQFVDEGQNSGTRVDHVKLFRRFPDLQFQLRIHEQILPSLQEHPGEIARCDAVVLHSGYDTSDEGQQRKRERDSKLLSLDLLENPTHPFVLFNLGMTHHFSGEHEVACEYLRKSIEHAAGTESHLRKSYVLLANSLRDLSGPQSALKTLEDGIQQVGWDPEIWFQIGMCHSVLGNRRAAIDAYEKIFDGSTASFYTSYDVSITGHKALYNMAVLYLDEGDYETAKRRWERSLTESPRFLPSAYALFDAAVAHKDFETADRVVGHARAVDGYSTSTVNMIERLGSAAGGDGGGRAAIEQALEHSGNAPSVRMALATWLLQHGEERRAVPMLADLSAVGIAEASYFLGIFQLRQGHPEAAIHFFERALEQNPGHEQTITQLAGLQRLVSESGL